MKIRKPFKKNIFIFTILFIVCLMAVCFFYSVYSAGQERTQKEIRYVRMIDVMDRHDHYKGHDYYNTYGYFVDRDSGRHFTDDITEVTFNSFKKNGNKGVEATFLYSIDDMEHTVKGDFIVLLGFIGMIFFTVTGGFSYSKIIKNIREYQKLLQHDDIYNIKT